MMYKILFFLGVTVLTLNTGAQSSEGCVALDLPFFTDFEDANLDCWNMIDANEDNLWWHIDETQATIGCSALGDKVVSINYNFNIAMNDWLVSPPLNLEAGINYTFSFSFGNDNSDSNVESIQVFLASDNDLIGVTNGQLLMSNNSIIDGCSSFASFVTVSTSGIYYLAFLGDSDVNQNILMIDDVYLGEGALSVSDNDFSANSPSMFFDNNDLIIHSKKIEGAALRIYNSLGQEVYRVGNLAVNNDTKVDLSLLHTGIYLVSMVYQNQVFTQQLIKSN